ncbi:hypothetical protein ABW19_dt0203695 [Dactylella cylindrospora]|nr:hypothetical protein ABW19_dt0203695 [Dactylella cylindrospora]
MSLETPDEPALPNHEFSHLLVRNQTSLTIAKEIHDLATNIQGAPENFLIPATLAETINLLTETRTILEEIFAKGKPIREDNGMEIYMHRASAAAEFIETQLKDMCSEKTVDGRVQFSKSKLKWWRKEKRLEELRLEAVEKNALLKSEVERLREDLEAP